MTISDIATIWRDAGVSCIPILANQTKRPALEWKEYQARLPQPEEISRWWSNGHQYGIALICGEVSGRLEMTEIEGRAIRGDLLDRIVQSCADLGAGGIWDQLVDGYSQVSPFGGLHLLYRISDHPVPGNHKLAMDEDNLVLAETRGEGGYVIGAPSPGSCHPSGEPWILLHGSYGVLPVISWDERSLLHQAISQALNYPSQHNPSSDTPPPLNPVLTDEPTPLISSPFDVSTRLTPDDPPPVSSDLSSRVLPIPSTGPVSPGDDFAARTDWADILQPAHWRLESVRSNGERMWTRPDKDPRLGASASTDYNGKPGLYVWSTSTGLPTEEPLSKLFVYAFYNFNGRMDLAAQNLARRGFGTKLPTPPLPHLPELEIADLDKDPGYLPNDSGNARYLWDKVKGRFLWLAEQRQYYAWNGRVWQADRKSTLENEFMELAELRATLAQQSGRAPDEKRWVTAGNSGKIDAALKCMKSLPGVSHESAEMDASRHLLNVQNGILDLETGTLHPHQAAALMTQIAGASYRPEATCPEFERFMEQVLPDPGMRGYVQRALGYTLLGDADQRAIFLVYGPSGTGKSTLMETIREVLGDYAVTAPPGTFKAAREKGPSNDLHRLRGRRFVATSETAANASFDEDLIKRLTGRDRVSSRELYQEYQEWEPRCCIWLATNHPPKFSSEDDAIWGRAKLIPFMTKFAGDHEVIDLARKVLYPEADGILNWLLEGLQTYRALGLHEPEQIEEEVFNQRLQADSVARFVDDRICDGVLLLAPERKIRASVLYLMYVEWGRQTGERPVGNRRFIHRLTASFPSLTQIREEGHLYWHGIGQNPTTGVLGTFY